MSEFPSGYEFSADDDRMDRELIHRWLSTEAYWALGRTREAQDQAIDASLNYGIFDASGDQVGYARAVTDGATFGWLCDVFVLEQARGAGLGAALVSAVTAELEGLGVPRVLLATSTAHDLYRRFGYESVEPAANWMIRLGAD